MIASFMQLLHALSVFAPGLAVNVVLVSAATVIMTLAGIGIWFQILRMKPLSGEPKPAVGELVLSGYVMGTFLAAGLMYSAGWLGFFRPEVLWIPVALLAFLGLAESARKIGRISPDVATAGSFILISLGPLLVSLTCPVPSWSDILEGNVAPVQRLITFSSYDPAHALPSAIYPANRATPLFTAFFGVVGRLVNLDAYQVLAATLVPSLVLTAIALFMFGRVVSPGRRHAGTIAVLAWVLSYNYLHLQSSRSTVWQMTFTLIALTSALQLLEQPGSRRFMIECALATAATILAHPFEALFTIGAVAFIVTLALWRSHWEHLSPYIAAFLLVVILSAPLLWTWWPDRRAATIAGIAALALGPFVFWRLFSRQTTIQKYRSVGRIPFIVAAGTVILSLFVRWNFYGVGLKNFLLFELTRYPVPTALSLVLVVGGIINSNRGALVAGAALLSASLPLLILPGLDLDPLTKASFRYEFPLKGMDFWLSGILTACCSVTLLWCWESRYRRLGRAFVVAALVLPWSVLLRLRNGPEHSAAGFYGMAMWDLRLAAHGYWRGWADPRYVVTKSDRVVFAHMKALARRGDISKTDRIDHIAQRSNLSALPFPAFTGIGQNLFLPDVDSTNIHTHGGRLFDIHTARPSGSWLLIEKPLLSSADMADRQIIMQSDRIVLARSIREPDSALSMLPDRQSNPGPLRNSATRR